MTQAKMTTSRSFGECEVFDLARHPDFIQIDAAWCSEFGTLLTSKSLNEICFLNSNRGVFNEGVFFAENDIIIIEVEYKSFKRVYREYVKKNNIKTVKSAGMIMHSAKDWIDFFDYFKGILIDMIKNGETVFIDCDDEETEERGLK